MSYLSVANMKNEKQITFIRKIVDVFDNHRGNIPNDLALTTFKDQANHQVLVNTMSPDLNGKQLIMVNNNDNILLAPVEIQSILCSDKTNNKDVNLIIQKNNKNPWEARSNEGLIKLLIRFDEPKVSINGFSIQFADSVRTKYKIGFTMVNEQNEIISQASGMISSFESNTHQFFQFTEPVEGINRVVVDLELVGTNIFEWKIKNISLYSFMNQGSLKALNDSGTIIHTMIPNTVLIKEGDTDEFEEETTKGELLTITNKTTEHPSIKDNSKIISSGPSADTYGTPLVAAPDTNHQYFDNLTQEQMSEISNIKRLYTVTDLHNGHNIYTFETNPMTRNLTLTFSPTIDLNKSTDNPEVDLEKLVQKGYIKQGGFKNYCLTFYIKLDELTMQDQNLVWKYGGWLFNDSFPQYARSTNIYIPLGSGEPQIATEYALNRLVPVNGIIDSLSESESFVPEGKWIGFQLSRQITGSEKCTVRISINRNPFSEEGKPSNLTEWETILDFEDSHNGEEHTANVWGGINEIISVTGAKYVSLYGISLYELKW